jgi:hypothetical protein
VAPATLSSGDGDDPGPPADAAVDIPPWASIAEKWRTSAAASRRRRMASACCALSRNGGASSKRRGQSYMTEPRLPNHEDTSTPEGRFGRRNDRRFSRWSSAVGIIIIVIILGITFAYLAMHSRF